MPRQDRVGLDQEDRPAATVDQTRQRGEDRTVGGFETRSRDLALEDHELVAQHEDLGVLGPVSAPTQHQQVEHESDETVETGHALILIDPPRTDQTEARNPRSTHQTNIRHPQDDLRKVCLHRLTSSGRDAGYTTDALFFLDTGQRLITKPEHLATLRQRILLLAVQGRLVPRDPQACHETTLGAIGRWGSGGTPTTGNPEFYGGTIPWVVIGDLNEGTVTHTAQTITEAGLANSSAKLIEPGTVLVAMYGASVGKLGIAGLSCATNQAIAHCIPDPAAIDRDYLFLLIRSLRASLVASAKGGAQPNISQTVLKGWNITLPPLDEQRRVVAAVDRLMALCDALEAALRESQTWRSQLLAALVHETLNATSVVSVA